MVQVYNVYTAELKAWAQLNIKWSTDAQCRIWYYLLMYDVFRGVFFGCARFQAGHFLILPDHIKIDILYNKYVYYILHSLT